METYSYDVNGGGRFETVIPGTMDGSIFNIGIQLVNKSNEPASEDTTVTLVRQDVPGHEREQLAIATRTWEERSFMIQKPTQTPVILITNGPPETPYLVFVAVERKR
jgi:hypothetical protein